MFEYMNGRHSTPTNMAIDEYVMGRVAETRTPIIRAYGFNDRNVVLGLNQYPDVADGVETTRRFSGGSHIVTTPNVYGITLCVPEDLTFDNLRSNFSKGMAVALNELGVNAVPNDVTYSIDIDGKIVAGHAMVKGGESMLIHQLIVIDPYKSEDFKGVRMEKRIVDGQPVSELEAIKKIPAISTELGEPEGSQELRDEIARSTLGIFSEGKYREIETPEIDDSRYRSESWVERRETIPEAVQALPDEEVGNGLKRDLPYCFWIGVPDKDFKRMIE